MSKTSPDDQNKLFMDQKPKYPQIVVKWPYKTTSNDLVWPTLSRNLRLDFLLENEIFRDITMGTRDIHDAAW